VDVARGRGMVRGPRGPRGLACFGEEDEPFDARSENDRDSRAGGATAARHRGDRQQSTFTLEYHAVRHWLGVPFASLVTSLSVHDLLVYGLMVLPVELLARLVAVPGSFAHAL
jgi:hypothetical protein